MKTSHVIFCTAAAAIRITDQCTDIIAETHNDFPFHRLRNIAIQKRTLSGDRK